MMLVTLAGFVPASDVQLQNIDSNYFGGRDPIQGTGYTPGCIRSPCTDGCETDSSRWNYSSDPHETDALRVNYCATVGGTVTSGMIPRLFFDCGIQFESSKTKKKGEQSFSIQGLDSCEILYNWGVGLSNNQDYLRSYDSLKKFIEMCPNSPDAPAAFSYMSGDVSGLEATDTAIYSDYQLWLRKVLYYDTTNPAYFCQCAEQIGIWIYFPTSSSDDSIGVLQYDTSLAVLYWLIQHTTCDTSALWREYEGGRLNQYELWQQSGRGALDTTLAPLGDLDSLFARHFLYASVSEPPQPGILSNATAHPNPTHDGTIISFGISKQAYVRINLFDVLGHPVSSPGAESLFEPGNQSVPLSLMGLPSGTYYARIMSAYGEVQTVKLVKE